MITEIYMVRHAHSFFSLEHEETRELSEKGWKDAAIVTDILIKENIDHILSSSYVRAIQTVEGLAKVMNAEVETDRRFRERDLAPRDHELENLEEAIRNVFADPLFKYPGGESNLEVQQRGIEALKDAIEKYQGQKIVIGIHGNIMACIMNYFDEKYDYDFWRQTSKPDIYKLTINENFELADCQRLWKEYHFQKGIISPLP